MTEGITIGKAEIRKDARQKVDGSAQYTADVPVANLKYGCVLRSSRHHARIVSLDTKKASGMEGILAVITAEDIPGARMYGEIAVDRPALAWEKVRFIGEPVAVIIAETSLQADQARARVRVEYEDLPPIHDPRQGMEEGACPIHPGGNLQSHIELQNGDIDQGFREADVILEETFSVPRQYPAYLEPEACLAQYDPDGTLTVWVSSQKPFQDRDTICSVLNLPPEQVRVKSAVVGGAFGGKEDSNLAVLASLAAWKTKASVRLVNTREESILAHPKRHAARLVYKLGAKTDGTLTALKAMVYLDTGAYASYGPAVGQLLTETVTGPYRIPNVRADTFVVYTNNPIAGAMRGFGSPQTNFAYESLMDMLATRLEMDPGELRRKNIFKPGDRSCTRVRVNQAEGVGIMLEQALQECERMRRIPARPGRRAGVGLALGMQTMGLGFRIPDDCTTGLDWRPDGRVTIHLGAPELGQGLVTASAQMAAEALGIDYDLIDVDPLDTSLSPEGGVTCASRMTYNTGNSLILAAQKVIEALIGEAAVFLKVSPDKLRYKRGKIHRADLPNQAPIPAHEIISRMAEADHTLSATATFSFPYGPEIPDHLPFGMPHALFCFGAHVARVEVDPDLGTVEVMEVTAIHDVGKTINRAGVEGQIEGGVATGLGYALSEEVKLKANNQWVDNFTEYLLPTALDVPPIKCILLELPEKSGPWGAKGIGEIALVPTPAAITNAIYDAIGKRVEKLPVKYEELI